MADIPSDLPPFPPDPSVPPAPVPVRKYRVVRLAGYFFGSIILCFFVVHYGRVFGRKAWGSLRLVNTVVNLTPTLLSILFAFVVDKDLADRMKWRWLFRLSVVSIGAGLSLLLWHQQALSDIQSSKQISDAVTNAVTLANTHSDGRFDGVNQHVGTLESKVDNVNQQQVSLAQDFAKATGDIDTHLGNVGKPDPPEKPKFQFSLWKDDLNNSAYPLEEETVIPNSDGSVPITFAVRNTSGAKAEGIDVWVNICMSCSFATEPKGFDKPQGLSNLMRHRIIGGINPGVTVVEGNEITIKVPPPPVRVALDFRVTCNTCEKPVSSGTFWINVKPQ